MTKEARYACLKTIKLERKISHCLQYTLDQNSEKIYIGFYKRMIKQEIRYIWLDNFYFSEKFYQKIHYNFTM